ncbi:hypothetical protein GCM10022232_32630 [Streptomyces plumbiresistens]|uniref:Uncharacterized protein n=1 Tax=Streptomyces plumbiresistens TaxID=511811 RepID=A0ABP7R8V0_9ACTN
MDISDCEGGDGRCTAYGRAIRRGGAAGGDPGTRLRADAAITRATAVTTVSTTVGRTNTVTAIITAGTAAAGGMRTQRTGTPGTRERRGPGGPGEFAPAFHDHP